MNWFVTLSAKYEFPEKMHDYEVSWDHSIDESAEKAIVDHIQQFVLKLHKTLIPKLGLFKGFKVELVDSLSFNTLAMYIDGTYTFPIIVVDVGNTKLACDKYQQNCLEQLDVTILHELAHGIQEATGKEYDEEEAETFANQYYQTGQIILN